MAKDNYADYISTDKFLALKDGAEKIITFHRNLKKNDWYLHEGQVNAAREIFNDGRKRSWLQCGRSYGKSHLARYVAARFAIQNPGSACYIIAPERKQAHEIHWIQGPSNITNIIPRELIVDGDGGLNKSELRVYLKNGSFIKLDGSDNESALRGLKPDLVIADEFQSWRPESWIAMEPNFIAKNTTVVVLATPPDRECFYTAEWRYHMQQTAENNPAYFYMEVPTSANPRYPKEALEALRQKYLAKGEEAVWLREHMAKFIPGGVNAVFGTLWNREKFTRRHELLMKLLSGNKNQLRFFTVCDPGTTSVFAVLFAAFNPYTSEVFLLDEIYEKDRNRTSSTQIFDRILAKERELAPAADWRRYSDEAAAWFLREVSFHYKKHINPTKKHLHTKESMVSTAKDLFLAEKLYVSERMRMFSWEADNYITDDKGDLPDKDDHLLDAFFYFLSASNWKLIQASSDDEPKPPMTIEEAFRLQKTGGDWTESFNEDYFH